MFRQRGQQAFRRGMRMSGGMRMGSKPMRVELRVPSRAMAMQSLPVSLYQDYLLVDAMELLSSDEEDDDGMSGG